MTNIYAKNMHFCNVCILSRESINQLLFRHCIFPNANKGRVLNNSILNICLELTFIHYQFFAFYYRIIMTFIIFKVIKLYIYIWKDIGSNLVFFVMGIIYYLELPNKRYPWNEVSWRTKYKTMVYMTCYVLNN